MKNRQTLNIGWTIIKLSVLIAIALTTAMTMFAIDMENFMFIFSCIGVACIILFFGVNIIKKEEEKTRQHNMSSYTMPDISVNYPSLFHSKKPLNLLETKLYHQLIQTLPDFVVLPRVQFYHFVGMRENSDYQVWFDNIRQTKADFIVCNKDLHVLAVIFLENSIYLREEQVFANKEISRLLSSVGIHMVRWPVTKTPSQENIMAEIGPFVFGSDILDKIIPLDHKPAEQTYQIAANICFS